MLAQEPLRPDILRPGDGHSDRAGLSVSPVCGRGPATLQSRLGLSQTLTAIQSGVYPPRSVLGPGGRGTSRLPEGRHGVHGLEPVWEGKRDCVCVYVSVPSLTVSSSCSGTSESSLSPAPGMGLGSAQ